MQYLQLLRTVSSAGHELSPAQPQDPFAAEVFSPADPNDSSAAQTSAIGPQTITFSSRVTGGHGLGMSVLVVSFRLEEPAAWSADGRFSLLGESGFACVSLVNLPQRTVLLLNEIAGDPPAAALTRTWTANGILAPGDYELEAIIHTGGTGQSHSGSTELRFHIPEPGALWLTIAAAGACRFRRIRQGSARTRTNWRSEDDAGKTSLIRPPPRSVTVEGTTVQGPVSPEFTSAFSAAGR